MGEGEVVALLGANEAGKTTTLLTISGFIKLLAGDVLFEGRSILGKSPHRIARDRLAHVPEDRALFFGMTVNETIRLSSQPGGADPFSFFPDLTRLAKRQAGLLSGGEQQMLAVGRAMASNPKLLMVDEMSLGLAPILVERLIPTLRRFADERGIGVLMVEQHIRLALRHADRHTSSLVAASRRRARRQSGRGGGGHRGLVSRPCGELKQIVT